MRFRFGGMHRWKGDASTNVATQGTKLAGTKILMLQRCSALTLHELPRAVGRIWVQHATETPTRMGRQRVVGPTAARSCKRGPRGLRQHCGGFCAFHSPACPAMQLVTQPLRSHPTASRTLAARVTRREQPAPALRHPRWHLPQDVLFMLQLPGTQPAAHALHLPVAGSTPPLEQKAHLSALFEQLHAKKSRNFCCR